MFLSANVAVNLISARYLPAVQKRLALDDSLTDPELSVRCCMQLMKRGHCLSYLFVVRYST